MLRKIPPVAGLALTYVRVANGWSQTDLAREVGVESSLICQYERGGGAELARERLDAYAEVMEAQAGSVDKALEAACELRRKDAGEESARVPGEPGPARRRAVEAAAALGGRLWAETARAELLAHLRTEAWENDRQEAARLWEVLCRLKPADRRVLVENAREYQKWAVCERLCEESAKAASADAGLAVELAELALAAAMRTPGDEPWRRRVQLSCWPFVANVRRVSSNLEGAERAFAETDRLRAAGPLAEPGPWAEWRELDLKASLRRDQRRFPEALDLLGEALAQALGGPARAHLLLNKSATLEQMGEAEGAVAALREARPYVEAEHEPAQLFALEFNLASSLCDLGRASEAAPLLPGLRKLAIELGDGLRLVRVLWLEGKTAAGQGRLAAAEKTLIQVRRDFAEREIAFDYALVTLELALLYAQQVRTAEVQEIANEALPIFVAQCIGREALATLQLFVKAAEREALTADLAQRLIEQLKRTRTAS